MWLESVRQSERTVYVKTGGQQENSAVDLLTFLFKQTALN